MFHAPCLGAGIHTQESTQVSREPEELELRDRHPLGVQADGLQPAEAPTHPGDGRLPGRGRLLLQFVHSATCLSS